MKFSVHVRLTPEESVRERSIHTAVAHAAGIRRADITSMRITRESVDARHKAIFIDRTYDVYTDGDEPEDAWQRTSYKDCADARPVVIVGAGPAGLFAALRCLETGLKPVILERGVPVEQRKRDIAEMGRTGVVNPSSNYGFGEGGAGAFSDGKLFTRSDKRGDVGKVLSQFCQHGADPAIMWESHPHIGSDRLPDVIRKIRATIQNNGGEIHFQTKVTRILTDREGKVAGAATENGKAYEGPVILATGHSAGELFRWMDGAGFAIQRKGIAVGVRLEHPQDFIDRIQYHSEEGRGKYLPPADYWFVSQVRHRGVYSFCMCPGGVIIPSSTEEGRLSVNGMSASARAGRYANSGMVVEIRPEDLPSSRFPGNLGMLDFVEALEERAWKAGGGLLRAPAQRMGDFINGKLSTSLPATSYWPGLVSADIATVLPRFIADRLRDGFRIFGEKAPAFVTNDALLIAPESRTSSPVRIVRDSGTLMAQGHPGLFPAGEGAGYAGGIVSAAMDGIAAADAAAAWLG